MRGVDTLEALAEAARERGMDRFALTDTNALYGFVFYRQICAETGLTPIAGAEVVASGDRAVLLARGREVFSYFGGAIHWVTKTIFLTDK